MVKNLPDSAADMGSILGLGRRKWQPIPVFLPEKSHGQKAWQATVHETAKNRTQLSERKSIMSIYKTDNQQGPTVQKRELFNIL